MFAWLSVSERVGLALLNMELPQSFRRQQNLLHSLTGLTLCGLAASIRKCQYCYIILLFSFQFIPHRAVGSEVPTASCSLPFQHGEHTLHVGIVRIDPQSDLLSAAAQRNIVK